MNRPLAVLGTALILASTVSARPLDNLRNRLQEVRQGNSRPLSQLSQGERQGLARDLVLVKAIQERMAERREAIQSNGGGFIARVVSVGRLSGRVTDGIPNNAYERPRFAENFGQRIRIFAGDSFFNRYYGQNGRALGYNFRDRDGLGFRGLAQNWVDQIRNRERWGAGERRLFNGDGSGLRALAMIAQVGLQFANAFIGAGGGYGGQDLSGALRRAQDTYNLRKAN